MRRIAQALPVLSVLSLALLTACGGGGGGPDDGVDANPTATNFSGTVIDGYIEGAKVCLDMNANLQCDGDEPTATSKADGTFSLVVTGLAADKIKAAHLLTEVPSTAKDADDGGKTLAEAGKSPFSLLAPAVAFAKADGSSVAGAVISPLTTLVSHEMITGNNTLDTAQTYVRERLGLDASTDLNQDFVAKENANLIEKAQMLAVAIGSVKKEAKDGGATDKEALLAALTYLQTTAAELQAAYTAAKDADSTGKQLVALVKEAMTEAAAIPGIADLVAEAKKTSNSTPVASVVALIEKGFYSADHVLEDCEPANSSYTCQPSYWKVQGAGGKIILDQEYYLTGASWTPGEGTSDDFVLTANGWVSEDDCPEGQSISYVADSTGSATIDFCNGRTERGSARMVDASGKTLTELGLHAPAKFAELAMPTGSELYWFDFASPQDSYHLWTGNKVSQWVWNVETNTGSEVPFTSLDAFIGHYSTANAESGQRFGWSGLQFSFDAGGTSAGGNLTLWSDLGPAAIKTGSATYQRRMVHGKEVLVIQAQAPENESGELVIFAVKDGFLYGGNFQSAAIKHASQPNFNKTMLDALLKAGDRPSAVN